MLNKSELDDIQNIESKYYMKPIIEAINLDISKNNIKWHEVFDKLYNYLENNKKRKNYKFGTGNKKYSWRSF